MACPFVDTQLGPGNYSTALFTTGEEPVSARLLGLNAAQPPTFKRTSMCTPLDLNYLKRAKLLVVGEDEDGTSRYEYRLGSVNGSNNDLTFFQYGDPFTWEVPAYSVDIYEAKPPNATTYWQPISNFSIAPSRNQYDSLTILFVTSCRIFYTSYSKDYIFPADEEIAPDAVVSQQASISSVLACMDWNSVCTPEGKCSSVRDSHDHGADYEYTRLALLKANMYNSISFRRGDGLAAQEQTRAFRSAPLNQGASQWIFESAGMFNTSLARAQYDTLSIALGQGSDEDGNEADSIYNDGRLCGKMKINIPKHLSNLNLIAVIGEIALGGVLILLNESGAFQKVPRSSLRRTRPTDNAASPAGERTQADAAQPQRSPPIIQLLSTTPTTQVANASTPQTRRPGRGYGT